VIGLRVPGLDPIHKVTIVPRGRALGITASLPTEDRHSYTKDWLEGQLTMLFGGRVAEEMIFGPEKVTTGAGNDIERATQMARRMVTRFGMSDAVGLMAIGDSDQQVFLGREMTQRREVSEHTAQLVDQEVKRILDEAHAHAREVLERERGLLEAIAQALLERETLDRDDVGLLASGKPLPPVDSEGTGRPEEEVDQASEDASESAADGEGRDRPTPPEGVTVEEGAASDDAASSSEREEREGRESPVSSPAARRTRGEPDPDTSRG
jgi:cell division protease FtsH